MANIQVSDDPLSGISICIYSLSRSTYHLAVGALIPLLVSSVSYSVVAACCLGGGLVVDRGAALFVIADSVRVEVCSNEGCEQGSKEEYGGCGTHLR